MSEQFKLCLLWLTGGSAAIFFALGWLPAALVDGTALPTGHDAFYHARRILDVASGEREFYEFDSRMHVPEGSWITWPWGYDYAMATVARLVIPRALPDLHLIRVRSRNVAPIQVHHAVVHRGLGGRAGDIRYTRYFR